MKRFFTRESLVSIALAAVVLWFGIQETLFPADWLGYVPAFLKQNPFVYYLIALHGIILSAAGIALALGFYRRLASAVLTVIFVEVIIGLYVQDGFSAIVIRDIGLAGVALALSIGLDRVPLFGEAIEGELVNQDGVYFVKANEAEEAIEEVTDRLLSFLEKDKRVLWLVCGGSNIPTEAEIMKRLHGELIRRNLANALSLLTVMLTDERYGPVGHRDSNWQQLTEHGFFSYPIRAVPTLQGLSLNDTVIAYGTDLKHGIAEADAVIAIFGVGADGHIAGILPNSAATEVKGFAAGYEAGQYVRITATFEALRHVHYAYAFVFGAAKRGAVADLVARQLPLKDQPAQIVKEMQHAYLYTDQV
jgi:6-phosphogluconolactonase/glucosamine-6-phosphate isomerase/deaminase/uncharacterized membrane protein YphA (DoxX/SURF4 family)